MDAAETGSLASAGSGKSNSNDSLGSGGGKPAAATTTSNDTSIEHHDHSSSSITHQKQGLTWIFDSLPEGRATFPVKLHHLLCQAEQHGCHRIIAWQSHGCSFKVKSKDDLVKEILPAWFRQSQFASFQRQLNIYGFRQITKGRDMGAYYHQHFRRDQPELAHKVARVQLKGIGKGRHKRPFEANVPVTGPSTTHSQVASMAMAAAMAPPEFARSSSAPLFRNISPARKHGRSQSETSSKDSPPQQQQEKQEQQAWTANDGDNDDFEPMAVQSLPHNIDYLNRITNDLSSSTITNTSQAPALFYHPKQQDTSHRQSLLPGANFRHHHMMESTPAAFSLQNSNAGFAVPQQGALPPSQLWLAMQQHQQMQSTTLTSSQQQGVPPMYLPGPSASTTATMAMDGLNTQPQDHLLFSQLEAVASATPSSYNPYQQFLPGNQSLLQMSSSPHQYQQRQPQDLARMGTTFMMDQSISVHGHDSHSSSMTMQQDHSSNSNMSVQTHRVGDMEFNVMDLEPTPIRENNDNTNDLDRLFDF